jgi:serine/threonine protein kinase
MHLMKLGFLLLFSKYELSQLYYRNINIISYKESFFEDATSCLCIVMDLADGGDLYNKMVQYKKKG